MLHGKKLQVTSDEYARAKNFQFRDYDDVKRLLYLAYCKSLSPKQDENPYHLKKSPEESKGMMQAKLPAAGQKIANKFGREEQQKALKNFVNDAYKRQPAWAAVGAQGNVNISAVEESKNPSHNV